jgi:secondary thiamine-phosphate synthase enzyme
MRSIELTVTTGDRPRVVDLTAEVLEFVAGLGDGLLSVFVPHATAGLALIELGAGSDQDLLGLLDELLPPEPDRFAHHHGHPGHGRDHLLPALVSPSLTLPVVGGRPLLGTWQSVVLVDTNSDNPNRKVRLSFLAG